MKSAETGEAPAEEIWVISETTYAIFAQHGGQYAVRKRHAEFGTEWLQWPEKHYETVAGARYAILLDLSDISQEDLS